MKRTTLTGFLTEKQIERVAELYSEPYWFDEYDFVRQVKIEIIEPNLAEINLKLGQENDPHYLAYAVLYVMHAAAAPNGKQRS